MEILRAVLLKEKTSEEEQAQQKGQCIYDNFDKAHIISYAKKANLNPLRANYYSSSEKDVMSKLLKPILLTTLPGLLTLQSFNISYGQSLFATITVPAANPASVSVVGRFDSPSSPGDKRNLWFLKDFAGYDKLGDRFSDVAVSGPRGQRLPL